MENTQDQYVFVRLYVMLGDADDSIEGHSIYLREEWDKRCKIFTDVLREHNMDSVYDEYNDYGFELNLDNYEVIGCSKNEMETINKFFKDIGRFFDPVDFLIEKDLYKPENVETALSANRWVGA